MKKGILFALAALCVSAVQAVTINWNSTDGTFTGFKDSNNNVVTWTGDFSITVSFSATSTPATIFQLLTANGADQAGEFRFNSGSWTENKADVGLYNGNEASWLKTGGDFSSARVNADGTNTITFKFNNYNADNKTYDVSYEIKFANGDPATNTCGRAGFNLSEICWTEVKTGEGVTLTSMTLNADNVTTSVPEPTALALLALGVAGLALRRKA